MNRNWPYRYRNWPYRYTRLQYTFRGKSISVYAIDDTHWLSVLRFFIPKKPEPIHFLRALWSSNSFPFISSSCQRSLFFGRSSKRLSAANFRYENRRVFMTTFVGLVSYILVNLGPLGELLTKQTYTRLVWIALQNFRVTKLRKPRLSQVFATPHEMHVCPRH